MKSKIKRCCLVLLTLSPLLAVAFAARSALAIDQIRSANATDTELESAGSESSGGVPTN